MCCPHPCQVILPQLPHLTGEHMFSSTFEISLTGRNYCTEQVAKGLPELKSSIALTA